jgi:predicted MFS family arabinose efflux permease
MRPSPRSESSAEPMLQQIFSGIRFVTNHPVLRWTVLVLLVLSVLVRPYAWLLAGFAGHVLHVDAKAYGVMLTVGGVGTIFGALLTTYFQSDRRARMLCAATAGSAVGLLLLSFVRDFGQSLVLLTILGAGTMVAQTISQVMLQVLAPEEMRGRSTSLYAMISIGFTPAGTLLLGAIASVTSLPFTYALGAVCAFVLSAWVYLAHPVFRRA